jgi:hypothetical protein
MHADFGLLQYTDGKTTEYWWLTLAGTTFTRRPLGSSATGHMLLVSTVLTEFAKTILPGQFDTKGAGVLRWHDSFAENDREWEGALSQLFRKPKEANLPKPGRVLHLVFFHKDVPQDHLLKVLHSQAERIKSGEHGMDKQLVDDLYFAFSSEDLKKMQATVTDGCYEGKLQINSWFIEQWPLALISTMDGVADLKKYYMSSPHSEARETILSAIDDDIREIYKKLKTITDPVERQREYGNIEARASLKMHRMDLHEYLDVSTIVQHTRPLDNGWYKLWQKLKDNMHLPAEPPLAMQVP